MRGEEVLAGERDLARVDAEFGIVESGGEDAARRPGELVAEDAVAVLGRGEATAEGDEGGDLRKSAGNGLRAAKERTNFVPTGPSFLDQAHSASMLQILASVDNTSRRSA